MYQKFYPWGDLNGHVWIKALSQFQFGVDLFDSLLAFLHMHQRSKIRG